MSANEGGPRKFGFISLKKKDAGPVLPRLELSDENETQTAAASNSQPKAPPRSVFEAKISREEQATIAKALEEDASLYDYDAVYEADKQRTREAAQSGSADKQPERKPKYIYGLFRSAAVRQLENERREERKIQKELESEQDGEKTECFVTESYRRKLEEIRQLEEAEKRNEAANDEAARYDPLAINRLLFAQRTGEKLPASKSSRVDEAEAEKHVHIQKKILNLTNRQFRKRKSVSGSESETSSDADQNPKSDGSHSQSESESESEGDAPAIKVAGEVTTKKNVPADAVTELEPGVQDDDGSNKPETTNREPTRPITSASGSAIETLKKQLETSEQKFDRWKTKCARRHSDEAIQIERERYFERKAIRDTTRDYVEPEATV